MLIREDGAKRLGMNKSSGGGIGWKRQRDRSDAWIEVERDGGGL